MAGTFDDEDIRIVWNALGDFKIK